MPFQINSLPFSSSNCWLNLPQSPKTSSLNIISTCSIKSVTKIKRPKTILLSHSSCQTTQPQLLLAPKAEAEFAQHLKTLGSEIFLKPSLLWNHSAKKALIINFFHLMLLKRNLISIKPSKKDPGRIKRSSPTSLPWQKPKIRTLWTMPKPRHQLRLLIRKQPKRLRSWNSREAVTKMFQAGTVSLNRRRPSCPKKILAFTSW